MTYLPQILLLLGVTVVVVLAFQRLHIPTSLGYLLVGLNFSLPQLHALRHQVLGLGTGQVAFTTVVVGIVAWLAALPVAAAFVIGAVFAQSSTIISSQLTEQKEENSPHGRLGLAMSVFQDVTAVPFLVVIPVLGLAVGAEVLAVELGSAMSKALVAFAFVFFLGRW